MVEFLHYSWECLKGGFELGDGSIALLEAICIFVWLYGQHKKDKPGVMKARKEKTATLGKWTFILVFIAGTFIIAPYRVYRESEKAKVAAEKALHDKAPHLDGFIDQSMIGDEVGKTNSLVFLQVTVGNSGGSPSIAERYELQVLLTNKPSINADPIDFVDEYHLNALRADASVPYTLKRSELISEKTSKAIQPGDAPRGWIAFKLPGITLASQGGTNFTIVLSFMDINGNIIFVTNGFWKGRPGKTMQALQSPKTLPGSGNLTSPSDVSAGEQTNSHQWLPPELPPGCSNVTVFFGGQGIIYPTAIAKISSEGSGTKFQIKDLPDYLLTDVDKIPNYSPRLRNMWMRWGSVQQDYGGKTVNIPILPYVVSNRFFVEVEIPFLHARRRLVMNDDFDTELSKLPRTWDRNYSTNAYIYEVVNEYTNPVLQVFYTQPNEVHVHGIFVVTSNSCLASFGGSPQLYNLTSYRWICLTNMQEITNVADFLGTNSIAEVLTNALYNWKQPEQRAIFKYPSNRYPGVLAN